MDNSIIKNNDELILDRQFLKHNKARKNVYICSPLSADSEFGVLKNMLAARKYMLYANKFMCVGARAPHAYLPVILCDKVPAERAIALEFGLKILQQSDELFVCGKTLSHGMIGEIIQSVKLNIPIRVFDKEIYIEVRKIVTKNGGLKRTVLFDGDNPDMAKTVSDLFEDNLLNAS